MAGKILSWFKSNPFSAISGGLGLILMIVGIIQMFHFSQPNQVEVIPVSDQTSVISTIVVDVAGAVESPGVFQLDEGSRVADALMAAGGLSADADRDYVARFINQAEPVRDGSKVFIPAEGESVSSDGSSSQNNVFGANVINVNTASLAQLDSLWGVGKSRAQDIIDHRPYSSLEELTAKAGLPANVLENNQGKISIY